MVHTNNKQSYPKVHILSMSLLHYFYKANMLSDIICSSFFYHVLDLYDIISCDASCDHSHMPLHHSRKREQKKRNIKSGKMNKKKRKMLVF